MSQGLLITRDTIKSVTKEPTVISREISSRLAGCCPAAKHTWKKLFRKLLSLFAYYDYVNAVCLNDSIKRVYLGCACSAAWSEGKKKAFLYTDPGCLVYR